MTTLQNELIKKTAGLSDESIKKVLKYVQDFVLPYEKQGKQEQGSVSAHKVKALKELEKVAALISPIADPDMEIRVAKDEKYGVVD